MGSASEKQNCPPPPRRGTSLWFEMKIVIVLILFCAIITPVLILCLPVLFVRFIVSKLGPKLNTRLGKILCSQSAFMAADDIYTSPQNSIVIWSETQGSVDTAKILDNVHQNWIVARREDGELKFPELQQYIGKWFGYNFWIQEKEFQLADHVTFRDLDQVTGDVANLVAQVGKQGYAEGKSPWELIIYKNADSNKGLQIFRVHHALCDGFAVLKLFSCTSTIDTAAIIDTRTSQNKPKERKKRGNPALLAMKQVVSFLRAPYSFAKDMVGAMDTFNERSRIPSMENEWNCVMSKKVVPISLVKEVKGHYQVGFQAVILAGVTRVWRNMMLRGETGFKQDFIHIGTPFPSKHPDKLRNAWTMSVLKLPIGEPSPIKRLNYIEGQVRRLKQSGSLMIGEFAPRFIGCFPDKLIQIAGKNRSVSAFASIMPGPIDLVRSYGSLDNVRIGFFAPLLCGEAGLGFSAFSYMDEVVVSLVADKAVIPELEQVQECADSVIEGIQELKDLMVFEA